MAHRGLGLVLSTLLAAVALAGDSPGAPRAATLADNRQETVELGEAGDWKSPPTEGLHELASDLEDQPNAREVTGAEQHNQKAHEVVPGLAVAPPRGFKATFWDEVPQFQRMTEVLTFMRTHPSKDHMTISTLSFKSKDEDVWQGLGESYKDNFAAKFVGCLEVKKAGTYRLWTRSNDGSVMWLGDKKVVDNDGRHGMQTRSAEVHLTPGMHHLQLAFWKQTGGGSGMKAGWSGPNVPDREFSAADVTQTTGPFDNSCIDTRTEASRAGLGQAFVYPEEAEQEKTAFDDKLAYKKHFEEELDRVAAQDKVRTMEMAADRRARASADNALMMVRADMNASSHPGLDKDQMRAANVSDAEKIIATRDSVQSATAEMEALIGKNSSGVVMTGGFSRNENISDVQHVNTSNASVMTIQDMDASRGGTSAMNDGRIVPGSSDDPSLVMALASQNTTNSPNATKAGAMPTDQVDNTNNSMGIQFYPHTPTAAANASEDLYEDFELS